MDDDFEKDVHLADDTLEEPIDLGDLGDTADVEADAESFDEAGEPAGRRSSGGARATARLTEPEPATARAARPPAPKAAKKAPAKKAVAKKAAAKKKSAPKKKAKAAKKKSKPAKRKAGRKK